MDRLLSTRIDVDDNETFLKAARSRRSARMRSCPIRTIQIHGLDCPQVSSETNATKTIVFLDVHESCVDCFGGAHVRVCVSYNG